MSAGPGIWTIVGTVSDAVAGLGTLGALVVALRVFNRETLDARRKQASRVILQLDRVSGVPAGDAGSAVRSYFRVSNFSDLPVYHCLLRVGRQWKKVRDLGPGTHVDISVDESADEEPEYAGIVFADAAGRHWERILSGDLAEVRPEVFTGVVREATRQVLDG